MKQRLELVNSDEALYFYSPGTTTLMFEFKKLLQGWLMLIPERDRFFYSKSECLTHVNRFFDVTTKATNEGGEKGNNGK